MLTDKQKQDAIDFVEKLNGEYQDKEFHKSVKKQFDNSQEFKKKLIKFLAKNEKKYNLLTIYIILKNIVEIIEKNIPGLTDINKEANQIAKLHRQEREENSSKCKENENV